MLIDALHAALEDRIVAFDSVGGRVAANVLVLGVVYGLASEFFDLRDDLVRGHFVGHQPGFAGKVLANDRQDFASCERRQCGSYEQRRLVRRA